MARNPPRRQSVAGVLAQHGAMSAGATLLIVGAAAASIQMLGDPSAGAPKAVARIDAVDGAAAHAPLSEVVVDPSLDEGLGLEAIDPALEAAMADAPVVALGPDGVAAPRTPLPKAPLPGLSQPGPVGPLPVIASDGRTAFKAYRRPFSGDAKAPRIAVVVGGLGFNARATQQAIDELPPEVTLSFMPYAKDLQMWIDRARAAGHEVMIEIPMEPFDSDANDTGPQTLLAASGAKDNLLRLEHVMAQATGYFAVMNYQGAKFAASAEAAGPVAQALKGRGLALVGNGVSGRSALGAEARKAQLPFAAADRVLDVRREAAAIDDQLLNLEALALQNGHALGAGFAYPVTIEQIAFWAGSLSERGYVLAPASAVMDARAPAS